MKNIKKFLLTMAMTMALGTSAFAASGFEFLFQLAGGAGVVIPNKAAKELELKGQLSADADISAQIGYMFQVKDGFGISVLGELGYSWDAYTMGYGDTATSGSGDGTYSSKDGMSIQQYYHSFKLGLLPKFNIGVGNGAIAIGIGGGVKIPLAGNLTTIMTIAQTGAATREELEYKSDVNLKRQDIVDLFSPSVIGYLKVTLPIILL